MGLKKGSYPAYCLDQAVWYFGTTIEAELDKASHKPSKEERKARTAREKVLSKYLDRQDEKKKFADPAAFFV